MVLLNRWKKVGGKMLIKVQDEIFKEIVQKSWDECGLKYRST